MKKQIRSLSLNELEKLQKSLEKEIKEREEKEKTKKKVREQVNQILDKHGLTLAETFPEETSGPKKASRRKAKPKYRNPDKPSQTWAGRGRKPKWLEKKLAAGAKLDDFKIKGA